MRVERAVGASGALSFVLSCVAIVLSRSHPVWWAVPAVAVSAGSLGLVQGLRNAGTHVEVSTSRQSAALTIACGAAVLSLVVDASLGRWLVVAASAVASGYFAWISMMYLGWLLGSPPPPR